MHQLRRPLPRLASLSLFTLGATGAAASLPACGGDDEELASPDELFDTLLTVCETYQRCDPEWFNEQYDSLGECFDYFTSTEGSDGIEGYSAECIDGANRFWSCLLDAYEGCELNAEAYYHCYDTLYDTLEECGLEYGYN